MNGNGQKNRYTQATRPTQRSAGQRTAQRPIASGAYRAQSRPSMMSRVPTGFWVLFATVLVALVLSLITMTVLLFAVEGEEKPSSSRDKEVVDKNDKDDDEDKSVSQNGGAEQNGVTVVKPPATAPSRSNYIASNSSSVSTISGISSEAAIIVDMDSYTAIGTKNADTVIYPASMTKVMTLLVACENVKNLNEMLTVKQEYVDYKNSVGASGENFTVGERVSVKDLLYLIIYDSNSIACQAIADYVSGSEAQFAELMNQKARSLGLTNTHFTNSTGIHDTDHYTTCREMAAIMAYALDNPLARTILTSFNAYSVKIYGSSGSRSLNVYTDWYSAKNRFADNPRLTTSTVKGGKTGYEDVPTACFVTYAEGKNGGKYICVTVGRINESGSVVSASTSTSDTKKIYNTYVK